MRQESANPEFLTEHEGFINQFTSELTSITKLLEQFVGKKDLQLLQQPQKSKLPNCCSCMSQIYNGVTCKRNSTKPSSTVKNDQDESAEMAGSMATSSKPTELKKKDGKHRQNLKSSINKHTYPKTSDDTGHSFMRKIDLEASLTEFASNKHKKVSAGDSRLPLQQATNHCFNLKCSKPETEVPGGLKRCTRCKIAVYCSRDCQAKHWKDHRSTCGKDL